MNTRRLREIEVSPVGMGCMGLSHGYGEIPDKISELFHSLRLQVDFCQEK